MSETANHTMSQAPLVSVIIIFLNEETFLAEAIESVLQQTYPHWELLLVDDGSSDSSPHLAQQYAQQYPAKIYYLEHENHQNKGMSASRNLGIQHAAGDYIAFLDGDDIWLPHKLSEQVALLEAHPEVMMLYGRTLIWHQWQPDAGNKVEDYTVDLGVQPNQVIQPPTLLVNLLQNKAQTPTTCNAIMRRTVFETIGSFEDSFRGMYEDQAFFAKVELKSPVYVAEAIWAKYRQHSANHSPRQESLVRYFQTRLPYLQWLERYLIAAGVSKSNPAWQTLQQEIWWCHHPRLYQLRYLPEYILGLWQGLWQHIRR